ncbi:MAG: hypothetical protein ACREH9_01455, partial [Pseudomonadota bacterium]
IEDVIREEYLSKKQSGSREELLAELRRLIDPAPPRILEETADHSITFETAPGLQLTARLLLPSGAGPHPAVLAVEKQLTASKTVLERVKQGQAVLMLVPRGLPFRDSGHLSGDWLANTRDSLIGRNLAADRAHDILCGVGLLAGHAGVESSHLEVIADGVPGIWALFAAAIDSRIASVSLRDTPWSLRAAFDDPLNRTLHAAVIPGFALKWDLSDVVAAIGPRPVSWTDPTDWMGNVIPRPGPYHYTISSDR